MDDRYRELIANRIKQTRTAKGYTVDEAAKRAGVGKSRWLNWECGVRTPKLDIIPAIAAAVGSTSSYLAGYSDHEGESTDSWRYIVANGENIHNQLISNNVIAFNIDKLRDRKLLEREILLIDVKDDSLSPTLSKGDSVLIDRRITTVTKPQIFAIKDNNNTVWFRWIRPELSGGYIVYTSDKEHFPDTTYSEEQFKELNIIGGYVGHWHWDT